MARIRDWLDLGKDTVSSIRTTDFTNIYELEWPETQKRLTLEHREAIDSDPRRFRRWLRTSSAILYGLTRRLAPHRRIIFVLAFACFFLSLMSIFTGMDHPSVGTFAQTAVSFLAMTFLLAMELMDKLKYRDELQLARDLQASLIPRQMPRSDHWDIAAFNWIANTVGGDIYDFVPLADGRIAVLFGDASGHGMAAGLVMAVAHASFRTQLDVEPSPESIMASLNRILCRTGGSRSFFSCCYVLLSPDGSYQVTLAGHPQLLRVDSVGRVTERIGRGAYPLGVKQNLMWEVVSGSLTPGDRLILHSDGLSESRNAQGMDLGDAHLEVITARHPSGSSAELVDGIVGEWRRFMGSTPAEDDVSIAAIRRV